MSDTASTESGEVIVSASQLSENLEFLQEKRATTREKALEFFIKYFRNNFSEEYIETNKATFVEHLKKSVKRGSEKEQKLAPLLVSLICITLGTESESIYKEFSPIFEEMISNRFHDDQIFSSFIDALGLICFVGNTDEYATVRIMELFKKVFNSVLDKFPLSISSALQKWGLLLTIVDKQYAFDTLIPETLESIVITLNNESVDVRGASGEIIALCTEISKSANESFHIGHFSNSISVHQLLDTLNEYSFERNRQQSKKDKDKQRNIFKQIYSYVANDELPEETLSFKHQKFSFNTWVSIHQLSCLRNCLGEGLHIHFVENHLIHEILDILLDKQAKKVQLSQVEKRMFLSPSSEASKHQSKQRSKQRDVKSSHSSYYND